MTPLSSSREEELRPRLRLSAENLALLPTLSPVTPHLDLWAVDPSLPSRDLDYFNNDFENLTLRVPTQTERRKAIVLLNDTPNSIRSESDSSGPYGEKDTCPKYRIGECFFRKELQDDMK